MRSSLQKFLFWARKSFIALVVGALVFSLIFYIFKSATVAIFLGIMASYFKIGADIIIIFDGINLSKFCRISGIFSLLLIAAAIFMFIFSQAALGILMFICGFLIFVTLFMMGAKPSTDALWSQCKF
ncbi:MAG: hypothetical protein ACOYL8_00080 [Patescibacteria group bacterium]